MGTKNIVEICLSPDLGGLELFMLSCVKGFSEKANVFTVVTSNQKLNTYMEEEISLLLKRNKFFPFIPALKLAKFIDKHEIDIIHFHWTRDIATVVLAKILSEKKPKIIQSRHMNMTRFKDDFYHRWLYRNIDKIHAITYQVKEQLKKYIPIEVRPTINVVYPGTVIPDVDNEHIKTLKEKYGLEDSSFVVGMVGRIEEAKGQYLLLEAIAKLKDLNIKVLIIGAAMDISYFEELKKKIVFLKIENQVIFTGFTKEVNEHIQLCNITVLATKKETFGLVVIESMVNAVPVIATNNGGPLEIIEDKVNGLLFDRTSDMLAMKINSLYDNSTVVKNIREEALRTVNEKFDATIQLENLCEVICEG
ncbi:MAG: Glycosyl transferase [uncultured Sulfurovum sp.]|uniref:Glycosyl transferase n=1 Tax=uncultured Sulfurovum sp. TaxID=269237 RepID=A0A6S6T6L0_9BACT|nr:MAG: Glycosyl transferase [uncultured Sulfurovum sp.]